MIVFKDDFQYPYKERGFADDKQSLPRPQSMHVEHKEKKFHIKFLKDSNDLQYLPKILHRSKNHRNLYVAPQKNIEALLDGENSTVNALSTTSNTSNIHRESIKNKIRIFFLLKLKFILFFFSFSGTFISCT